MSFELCIFDMDDTLLRTGDLVDLRGHANCGPQGAAYRDTVRDRFLGRRDRHIYPLSWLVQLRQQRYPQMKLAIFTRAPRAYTETILSLAYPNFQWDAIVTFEDVARTKPFPDGIRLAMRICGLTKPRMVVVVGDSKSDIVAAYRAGTWAAVETSSWPYPNVSDNYYCRERVPDGIVQGPETLSQFFLKPLNFLPIFERLKYKPDFQAPPATRVDRINHFNPLVRSRPTGIYTMGKLFAHYENLAPRYTWHAPTKDIEEHKEADVFPEYWVTAIREAIKALFPQGVYAILSVVPFKPGRKPRLEKLLAQVEKSLLERPIARFHIQCVPDLLSFKPGVLSHHGEHLSREQRFENVRDYLMVKQPNLAAHRHIILLDDVVTTGASLLYAKTYLSEAGAQSVACLALAQTISDA